MFRIRTRAPVGMEISPLSVIIFEDVLEPAVFGLERVGKVALLTFDTMEPTPMEIIMVPRVAIKGGRSRRDTISTVERSRIPWR